MTARRRFALLLLLASFAGCDGAAPPVDPAALPAPTFGDATIEGTVRFVGDVPQLAMIDTGGTCRGAPAIQEETIVVNRAGGLRDVVVWLADAPASSGAAQPAPTLDQVGCRYVPHVIGVQVAQPLRIKTSDEEFHNVHWVNGENPGANFGVSLSDPSRMVVFNAPEFIRTTCHLHPWMEAFIAVLPNPFFGVSDADGRFTIARVPAGTYQANAWHRLLGERTASVTVGADGKATLDLTYARPTPKRS